VSNFCTPTNCIHIINAHFSSPKNIDNNNFSEFLDFLSKIGEIINFDVAACLINSKNIDVNRPTFALSFDDGFIDCYNFIFPELRKRNIKAAFFINSHLLERDSSNFSSACHRIETLGKKFMNWNMVEEMSKSGQIIGSHGSSHIRFSDASFDSFKSDVLSNHSAIYEHLGFYPSFFAWPYGRNSDISLEQVNFLTKHYSFIFGGDAHKLYTSFSDKVINRRHIEPFWSFDHIKYFVSYEKVFNSN
jgi:peptidoglycan/xylan/chitin deacetylase (PgdA/CDA1 family)